MGVRWGWDCRSLALILTPALPLARSGVCGAFEVSKAKSWSICYALGTTGTGFSVLPQPRETHEAPQSRDTRDMTVMQSAAGRGLCLLRTRVVL